MAGTRIGIGGYSMTCDAVSPRETANSLSFRETVRTRRSVRSFRPTAVPDHILREVLADAQLTPSNCNTQPWNVHVVSGRTRVALTTALLSAEAAGTLSLDFTFDTNAFHGQYRKRSQAQGAAYYQALGIARDDATGRREAARHNLSFFGAPYVALLFLPSFGDDVRVAADIGMYAQTFLLTLAAQGLVAVPKTILGYYADTVRDVLAIPDDMKMLFGISFGHADEAAPSDSCDVGRVPITESATFHP